MIDHLHIKNFMCFKELNIPTLKRVNLIAGKNNAGKTTLLDAIRILKSDGDNAVVNHILNKRKVFIKGSKESYNKLLNTNIESDSIEFNKLRIDFFARHIGDRDRDYKKFRFSYSSKNDPFLSIEDDPIPTIKDPLLTGIPVFPKKSKPSEELEKKILIDKELHEIYNMKKWFDENILIIPPPENLVYVPFNSDFDTLSILWEKVALTEYEQDVYQILQETIQPNLVRLNVGREIVNIKLENNEKPVPLSTLGDGVHRILLIALSLANAKDSILLIDELELGLHYSALEKLWKMIFKYAQKWNIQVFTTTHSQDVLRTFHYVADDAKYIDDAQYTRLQINRKGENEAIIFDGKKLRETLDLQLEIR